MINLVPHTTLQIIKRRYYARIGIIVLVLMMVWLLAILIVLSTIGGVLYFNKQSLDSRAEAVQVKSAELATITGQTETALQYAMSVIKLGSTPSVHTMLVDILAVPHQGIRITAISVARNEVGPTTGVTLQGVFAKREDLVGFVDTLRQQQRVERVLSPVENLIKESNGQFSVTVVMTAPQS